MKIILKNIPKNQGGVYAIFFDEKFIYIGNTKNLYRRLYQWKNLFIKKKEIPLKMYNVVENASLIVFEVLQASNDPVQRSILEEDYIYSYKKSPLPVLNTRRRDQTGVKKEVFLERLQPIPEDGILNRPRKPRQIISPLQLTSLFMTRLCCR